MARRSSTHRGRRGHRGPRDLRGNLPARGAGPTGCLVRDLPALSAMERRRSRSSSPAIGWWPPIRCQSVTPRQARSSANCGCCACSGVAPGTSLSGHAALALRPAARRQADSRDRARASVTRAIAAHAHRAALFGPGFSRASSAALCMPYLGGASWSSILGDLKTTPPSRRHRTRGRSALGCGAASRTGHGHVCRSHPAISGRRQLRTNRLLDCRLSRRWLALRHQRGLIHLDIKPSNVLIAGDGQPMLLDFHFLTR